MSVDQNVQAIQDIYAAFGRGDIDYIINQLSDDVAWDVRMGSVVPWSGSYPGRANINRFFDNIFNSVEVLAFEPQDFVAQGETVASLGEFACRVKATGKTARTRWCFVWKLADGVVTSYEQFHDPAIEEAFKA